MISHKFSNNKYQIRNPKFEIRYDSFYDEHEASSDFQFRVSHFYLVICNLDLVT